MSLDIFWVGGYIGEIVMTSFVKRDDRRYKVEFICFFDCTIHDCKRMLGFVPRQSSSDEIQRFPSRKCYLPLITTLICLPVSCTLLLASKLCLNRNPDNAPISSLTLITNLTPFFSPKLLNISSTNLKQQ